MVTRMTDEDWDRVVQVFRAVRSRRGDKGRNDRRFLEALHYFCVHNITWRALPAEFGNWNSVWMVDSQTTNSALSAMVS
jgi:transposase